MLWSPDKQAGEKKPKTKTCLEELGQKNGCSWLLVCSELENLKCVLSGMNTYKLPYEKGSRCLCPFASQAWLWVDKTFEVLAKHVLACSSWVILFNSIIQ